MKYIYTIMIVLLLLGLSDNNDSEVIANETSDAVDITDVILKKRTANCADYVNNYKSSVQDVNRQLSFQGNFSVSVSGDKCIFTSNAIPNHNFNDGESTFVTNVSEQNVKYEVNTNPQKASKNTELSLTTDNAIFLNGVKLDLLSAGCYGVGDGKIGCSDITQPWRFDPMSSLSNFNIDSHNAHTQGDGTYHYHGSPVALFDSNNAVVSPVIGFAADGFPIFGSYFDDNGTIRKAKSSYQLKKGRRRAIKGINPGGRYDGRYRNDYRYVAGSGDLDECNGMTINGVYGYFVTESYPWVIGCFKGTPDSSFNKS